MSSTSSSSLSARLKDPSLLRDKCYIDGAWVGAGETVVTNPVNMAEIAKVPNMGAKETTQAVEAAEKAFPAWAKFTAKQRSNILRKWFELIVANREDLALIPVSDVHARRPNLLVSVSDDELSPAALAARVVMADVARQLVEQGRWAGASLHES